MTTQNIVIESLKEKASTDPVSNAVLHMWALRRRARNEVTINGLLVKMKKEGFAHKKEEYEPLLRLMARLGIGRLHTDGKGKIIALRQIDTTLQSIGQAVCNNKADTPLKRFKKKPQYRPIKPHRSSAVHGFNEKPTANSLQTVAVVTVTLQDKTISFPLPEHGVDSIEKARRFLASL